MIFDLPPDPPKFWLPPKPAIIRPATPELLARQPLVKARRRASGAPPTVTYITELSNTSGLTTYTFTDTDIGTPAFDRLVVVGVTWETTASRALASGTIGGNAAALIVTGNANAAAGIFALRVPSAATATITATLSASVLRASIGVWTITGQLSDTPTAFDESSSNVATTSSQVDLNVITGGVAVAMLGLNAAGAAVTWTGATERFDADYGGSSRKSGADYSNVGATETPHSIIASYASTTGGLAAASWR